MDAKLAFFIYGAQPSRKTYAKYYTRLGQPEKIPPADSPKFKESIDRIGFDAHELACLAVDMGARYVTYCAQAGTVFGPIPASTTTSRAARGRTLPDRTSRSGTTRPRCARRRARVG